MPAAAVGRWAVVPTGSFNDPVPVILTLPLFGASVRSPVLVIVEFLKLRLSTTTLPVPFARNSKLAFDSEVCTIFDVMFISPILPVVPTTSLIYALFHLFVAEPKLYVLVVSGIILLATSALNVTLSVSASPTLILPDAVIFPVACNITVYVCISLYFYTTSAIWSKFYISIRIIC